LFYHLVDQQKLQNSDKTDELEAKRHNNQITLECNNIVELNETEESQRTGMAIKDYVIYIFSCYKSFC